MAKKTTSTTVNVNTNGVNAEEINISALALTDQSGLEILEKIQQLAASQKRLQETPYKCGHLSINGVTLREEKDLVILGKTLAQVKLSNDHYNDVMINDMKLNSYPAWNYEGYNYEDIRHDIILRSRFITQEAQQKKLAEAQKIAERYITPAEKRQQDMKLLSELLNGVELNSVVE